MRRLLAENKLLEQCISMDALHLDPATLAPIAQAGGWFLIALKGNQAELSTELQRVVQYLPVEQEGQTIEKGHGRIDQQDYRAYDVRRQYFDARWYECRFTTLISRSRPLDAQDWSAQSRSSLVLVQRPPQAERETLSSCTPALDGRN